MSTRLWVTKVFCYGVIYLLCQVTWCDSEVTWVTRNVTDSFRIGEDGCLTNKSVCTFHQASCQDDGSCLCNTNDKPHFRNPTVLLDGTTRYGTSYGCITETAIRHRVGDLLCLFRPYQVIPNDHKEPATQFNNDPKAESCIFQSFEVKFPNNRNRTRITWINETYFQLNYSTNTLYFLWKKSVPELEGLIITINLYCKNYNTKGYANQCLQAKVFGTWRSSGDPETPSPTAATSSISGLSSTNTGTIPTTTSNSTNAGKSSGESELDEGMISVAVVVPLIVLIVVILVAIYLMKRRKRNRDRNISKRSTSQGNNGTGHINLGMSSQNKNSQSTSAGTYSAYISSGSEYAEPDISRVVVNGDTYAVPDKNKPKKDTAVAPNVSSDSEYATPDIERIMVNGDMYAVSDKNKNKPKQKDTAIAANVSSDSEYATPDIERIMVNGDMYAVANKNNTIKKPKQELNYMDPENLGLDENNPDAEESTQPTEYAAIVGVMHEENE